MVSRYLIEPYGEKEITYNVNLSKENEEILSFFLFERYPTHKYDY